MERPPLDLKLCISRDRRKLNIQVGDRKGVFLLLKREYLLSREQLSIAYEKAVSIHMNSRKFREVEPIIFMLLTGISQIGPAMERAGLSGNESEFLVAYAYKEDLERFLQENPWVKVSDCTEVPEKDSSVEQIIFERINNVAVDIGSK